MDAGQRAASQRLDIGALSMRVARDAEDAARRLADELAALLSRKPRLVLGLPTGRSPLALYRELACRVDAGELSLAETTVFLLDEYLDLPRDHPASYRAYAARELVAPLGLDPARVHVPDSEAPPEHAEREARRYGALLRDGGGLDVLYLGIGSNGHLAFNEPGSARGSSTRVVELAPETRAANAADFPLGEDVPRRAITLGLAELLDAGLVRALAFGAGKAAAVRRTVQDPIGPAFPATFLREHAGAELWLDEDAARGLEHGRSPHATDRRAGA